MSPTRPTAEWDREPSTSVAWATSIISFRVSEAAVNAPKACDFCGRSAPEVSLSREHVFAKSLRDAVQSAKDHTYASVTDKSGQLKGGKSTRPVSMFDVTSRRVCRECNSEWMSELEVVANPILRRLIAGETTLTGAEVDVVRRWLVKTAVVSHMAEPDSEKPAPTVDPATGKP